MKKKDEKLEWADPVLVRLSQARRAIGDEASVICDPFGSAGELGNR